MFAFDPMQQQNMMNGMMFNGGGNGGFGMDSGMGVMGGMPTGPRGSPPPSSFIALVSLTLASF